MIFYALVFFIAIVSLKMYYESDAFNLKCIISHVDGNKYCVRERNKIQLVADLLAETTTDLKKLVAHMGEKYPTRENVKRLVKNFNPQKVSETLPTSEFTAYSENKGEKLAFCTTTEKTGNRLIDKNTLMFVALHELSHVMTVSIGHKKEFWENFKFLIGEAKEIKIYQPVDYKKKPQMYCGMTIKDSPYFDL
tara:strand:- start:717 stop:1295 length:579 start_codon:yes stop_codon:yes gene_type:complete